MTQYNRQIIERIKQLDLRQVVAELAPQGSVRESMGGVEVARPCPKCGGKDRFHVRRSWWFCRECHPKREDTIAFVRWLHGGVEAYSMDQALAILTPFLNGKAAAPTAATPSFFFPSARSREQNQALATHPPAHFDQIVRQAQHTISASTGFRGRNYLLGRRIWPASWQTFHLGYRVDVPVPGSNKIRRPAITIPWFVDNRVVAIRYRFIEDGADPKKSLHPGSKISGCAYWCIHPDGAPRAERDLYLVEGELNAISIFQKGYDAVSLGSESAKLFPDLILHMSQYKRVIVWYDRQLRASRTVLQLQNMNIHQLKAVSSVMLKGDANNLLQTGQLAHILASL